MGIDLKEIHDFAVEVAKKAGVILIEASKTRSTNIRLKKNTVDIVTETDEKLEEFIRSKILSRYPHHKFVGEESYSAGQTKKYLVDDDPTWVIDPLDGTVNYVHLFPMICVSIGFTLNGKPVVGAVNAPLLNQTYSAYQGGGSWLNGDIRLPLQNTPIPENAPRGCLFLCEWGKDRRDIPGLNLHKKVESFVNMASEESGRNGLGGMVHGMRSLGSATMDMCFVATGAFDMFWEGGCWEWDVCAGIIIVEEAGGKVTTANPPESTTTIPPVELGSRLYLAVRACEPTEKETSSEQQDRLIREVWKRVSTVSYPRPT